MIPSMKANLIFLVMGVCTCDSLGAQTADGVVPAIGHGKIAGLTLSPEQKKQSLGWAGGLPIGLGELDPGKLQRIINDNPWIVDGPCSKYEIKSSIYPLSPNFPTFFGGAVAARSSLNVGLGWGQGKRRNNLH